MRFSIDGWKAIRTLLGERLPPTVLAALDQQRTAVEEFVIDLDAPSRLDKLGLLNRLRYSPIMPAGQTATLQATLQ